MKYFASFGLLAALVMAGAASARPGGPNDGALSVKNADGRVVIVSKGAVIGRFDRGQVTVKDPNPYDGTGPIVTGADRVEALGEKTTRYSGSNIRFRIIGGAFTVNVFGTDIDLSAVGRGMVTLNGSIAKGNGANNDASYAVNGGAPEAFPPYGLTFPLAAPPSSAGG
ncbi:MAG TPA: hypothetical protein VF232_04730 [Gaiellaceae bacterium]